MLRYFRLRIYYSLTQFVSRVVTYQDQVLVVQTELARSANKDRDLNILQYEKQTRSINSLLDATVSIYRKLSLSTEKFRKTCRKIEF